MLANSYIRLVSMTCINAQAMATNNAKQKHPGCKKWWGQSQPAVN